MSALKYEKSNRELDRVDFSVQIKQEQTGKLTSSYPQILQEQRSSDLNDCFYISSTTCHANTKSMNMTTLTEDKSKESLQHNDKSYRGSYTSGMVDLSN